MRITIEGDSPAASAASGGRKRITVPARPTSMRQLPIREAGETRTSILPTGDEPMTSMLAPRFSRAAIIKRVSRASSRPVMVLGASARAARTRARLEADFEPGTETVAWIG
jgi:hypothetical protein